MSLRDRVLRNPHLFLNKKVLVTGGPYENRLKEGEYLTIIGISSSGEFLLEGFESAHRGEGALLIFGKRGNKPNCLFIKPEHVTFIKSVAKAKPNTLFSLDDL